MQHQVVRVPPFPNLPLLIITLIILYILFIPITLSKSTIEPCNSSDPCLSFLHYILPYDSKLSEIAYLFKVNITDILGANSIDPQTLGDQIFAAESTLKVPIPCSCVDGIRRYVSTNYTIRPADTVDSISEGFGGLVSAQQIRSSNGINATNPLISGQSLVVPLPCTCFGNVNNGNPAIYMSYVVKNGENLPIIATQFGTTTKELEAVNGLGQPVVNPGDILSIPISACSSAKLKWYKESLIVANGSYALTASNCIKCVCGADDLNLRCWPSGIALLCSESEVQCKDSHLLIGDSIINHCKVTTCIYRGHNGGKIFKSLSYSWQTPCPGNQSYNDTALSPSPSCNPISPSPSPYPLSISTTGTTLSNNKTKQNLNDISNSSQPKLFLLTYICILSFLLQITACPCPLGLPLAFFISLL